MTDVLFEPTTAADGAEATGHTWSGSGRVGNRWTLDRQGSSLVLETGRTRETFVGTGLSQLSVRWRWLPWLVVTTEGVERRRLRLRIRDALSIWASLALLRALAPAYAYRGELDELVAAHLAKDLWIPYDTVTEIEGRRPVAPAIRLAWATQVTEQDEAVVEFVGRDLGAFIASANETIRRQALAAGRPFFDRVEKSPLTDEQASAVLAFDSRVRVIAAAGSGKTSVMVARAAYAIEKKLVEPHRILMLAFNADAADELRERVAERLGVLDLPSEGLEARTFHSFGRAVIGEATGRKPSIAKWVEDSREDAKVLELVNVLREESPGYRYSWDAFRLLFGRLGAGVDGGRPDDVYEPGRYRGFRTFRGDMVRSQGERLIADWLLLHGIRYRYEEPYSHDTATAKHSQYRPDFHYPEIDVWHEHWALDAHGRAPDSFKGYAESMAWKRRLHAKHGTDLVETTWHDVVSGDGLAHLERELRDRGLIPRWDPERFKPSPDEMVIEHDALAQLIKTFMTHVKSNGLSREDVAARVAGDDIRAQKFLELYWPVHDAWDEALREAQAIDFDEMLAQAALYVEQDENLARYDLVLVDEFQDSSRARARLVRALLKGRGKHLLAVGDDWQAINRFAGADLSVMTSFDEFFGPATTVRLQRTFRCTQTIADVAGRFVSRNPAQIPKTVVAADQTSGPQVRIVRVDDDGALRRAIRDHLRELASREPGGSAFVLGRYRRDHELMPGAVPGLDVSFRTIHRSKGLEADHVVLPKVVAGRHGFPSGLRDDPVLALAMSEDDGFEHSEERRLLYVALTRARRSVTLFTVAGAMSSFVRELKDDPDVVFNDLSRFRGTGHDEPVPRRCPTCQDGVLVQRAGKYGVFLGCSEYPRCRQTAKA
ncbi:UvrD-helicase domain-containing protein [Isoptericola sp. NPDC056578]|uniref:UvrD-helicase domain-containing protein n=1 Tax=Isoptericola sp. NPDC056578 TaxID=3345870 RepID=UPI00368546A8